MIYTYKGRRRWPRRTSARDRFRADFLAQRVAHSAIILPTRRCERISLKNVIEPRESVRYQLMNLAPCDGTTPGALRGWRRGGACLSKVSAGPDNGRGVRRISKRTKIKNDPVRARERKRGRRKRKDFSSFSPPSAPSSVCCVPARCPSDCPSSLFILTAFYPGGMINGFTEAPRYLSLSLFLSPRPSSDPLPSIHRSACLSSTRARAEFSGFLRAGLSCSPGMAIVRHRYTPFLCPRCIALISRRHETERLTGRKIRLQRSPAIGRDGHIFKIQGTVRIISVINF